MHEGIVIEGAAARSNAAGAARAAAAVAVGAAAVALALLAALHLLKPDLDPNWRFVSEYALGAWGWLMQLVFLLLALGFAAIVPAAGAWVRGPAGLIGLALAGLAAAALVAAAFFVIDPITAAPEELTGHGRVHGLASMVGNPSAVLAALLISLALARLPGWADVRRRVLWAGILPAACLLLLFAVIGLTLGRAGGFGPAVPLGWPNRLLVVAYCGWLITVALLVLRTGAAGSPHAAQGRAGR